jgi:hypothetical protein
MNAHQHAECDTDCEILVSPIPRPKTPAFHVSTRAAKRSVYFVDTWKPNSLAILRRAKALLEQRGVSTFDIWSKKDPSRPLTPPELDRIVREGEGALVLLGVADCGSCSSGSSLDAILLQQRGVTAIPVLTVPFVEVLSRLLSIWQADSPLSSIALEHPIQDLGATDIERRGDVLAEAVEGFLP